MPDQSCKYSEQIEKMYEDMYVGGGKNDPSITTRLDRVEQVIEVMLSNSRQERLALYATILAIILNIIATHIKF